MMGTTIKGQGFISTKDGEEIIKDTLETLDYNIDWTKRLANFSGVIDTSVWTIPTGITQATPIPSFSGAITTIFLSGGSATVGDKHTIRNTITTTGASPRILIQSFIIEMAAR